MSSMLNTLAARFANEDALIRIRRDSKPAVDQGKTECCRSGFCCWRRPCELGKGDPEKIAAHLAISPGDLFREHLIVDTYGNEDRLVLRPRRQEQSGGRMITADETFDINTPCVFLDVDNQNACKIHEAKPEGGAAFKCWEPGSGRVPTWEREDLVRLGWDGSDPDASSWGEDE